MINPYLNSKTKIDMLSPNSAKLATDIEAIYHSTLNDCCDQFYPIAKTIRAAIQKINATEPGINQDLAIISCLEDKLDHLTTTKVNTNQQLSQLQIELDQLILNLFELCMAWDKPYSLLNLKDPEFATPTALQQLADLTNSANLRLIDAECGNAYHTHTLYAEELKPQAELNYFNNIDPKTKASYLGDLELAILVHQYFNVRSSSYLAGKIKLIVNQLDKFFTSIPANLKPEALCQELLKFTTGDKSPVGCQVPNKVTQLNQLPPIITFNFCTCIAAYMIYQAVKNNYHQLGGNRCIMDNMFDFAILWQEQLGHDKNIIAYFFNAILHSNLLQVQIAHMRQSRVPITFFKSKGKIIMEAIQTYLYNCNLCPSKREFLTIQMLKKPAYNAYLKIIQDLMPQYRLLSGKKKRVKFLAMIHHHFWNYYQEHRSTCTKAYILHFTTLDSLLKKADILHKETSKEGTANLQENA
jgi:hypothetical protein